MKYLILDNIRSAYNVGAIFRTADGAGVAKIFLVGFTPTPTDRFGRVQTEIQKTSLGACDTVPWEYAATMGGVIAKLKEEGFSIVAVEQTSRSVSIAELVVPEKVVYVVGNEIEGVSVDVIDQADTIVAIPMRGSKESLNVSVATGIVLYHGMV